LVRCREIPNLIALILSLEPPLLIDDRDGATAERVSGAAKLEEIHRSEDTNQGRRKGQIESKYYLQRPASS
jgi:hypothetical protein